MRLAFLLHGAPRAVGFAVVSSFLLAGCDLSQAERCYDREGETSQEHALKIALDDAPGGVAAALGTSARLDDQCCKVEERTRSILWTLLSFQQQPKSDVEVAYRSRGTASPKFYIANYVIGECEGILSFSGMDYGSRTKG
jgi:hypothetical protein